MLSINLKVGEKVHNIQLPEEAVEVPFNRGLQFEVHHQNASEYLIREQDFNYNYYFYLIANCLSEFLSIDINDLLDWDITDLVDSDGNILEGVIQKHLKPLEEEVDRSEVFAGLYDIYHYIRKILQCTYPDEVGKPVEFMHNGVQYTVPYVMGKFLGQAVYSKFTLGQTVDIQKIYKYFKALQGFKDIEKLRKDDMTLTEKQNNIYRYYLQIIAIAATEKGKNYPDNPAEASSYVLQKITELKDINYYDANRVIFFLMSTIVT